MSGTRRGRVVSREPWTRDEELALIQLTLEDRTPDFARIHKRFAKFFHRTRTPQSLRAHFYRLKRTKQLVLPRGDRARLIAGLPTPGSRSSSPGPGAEDSGSTFTFGADVDEVPRWK